MPCCACYEGTRAHGNFLQSKGNAPVLFKGTNRACTPATSYLSPTLQGHQPRATSHPRSRGTNHQLYTSHPRSRGTNHQLPLTHAPGAPTTSYLSPAPGAPTSHPHSRGTIHQLQLSRGTNHGLPLTHAPGAPSTSHLLTACGSTLWNGVQV